MLLLTLLLLLFYFLCRLAPVQHAAGRRLPCAMTTSASFAPCTQPRIGWTHRRVRSVRKPPWVIRELLLIKAWTPKLGCRRIAEVFNRRHADDGVPCPRALWRAS